MTRFIENGIEREVRTPNEIELNDYLVINKDKNEITLEIPLSKLMNPEENKKMRGE